MVAIAAAVDEVDAHPDVEVGQPPLVEAVPLADAQALPPLPQLPVVQLMQLLLLVVVAEAPVDHSPQLRLADDALVAHAGHPVEAS